MLSHNSIDQSNYQEVEKIITGLGGGDVFVELFFEVNNFFWFDGIEVTSDTSVDDTDLLSDRHWFVLILLNERDECLYISGILIIYLQKFGKTLTSGKKLLGGGIHIGTELGEGSDFTVLGQIQLHGTGNLFHGLHLGGGTDTGDGKTDVDGWTDTLIYIIVTFIK